MGILVHCSGDFDLKIDGSNLLILHKKDEETIPISNIQGVTLSAPGFAYGKLVLSLARANTFGLNLGLGIGLGLGAERTYNYIKSNYEQAKALRDYIADYAAQPPAQPEPSGDQKVVSVVDEIRGLKTLLDEGILTEEEFTAKKRQLLGL